MAFNEENLSVIGGESSSGPSIYAYNAAGDDVSVDMYFDSKYDTFKVDDIIHVSDTDSYAIFRVTASGSKNTGVDVQAYVSSATGSGQTYTGGGSLSGAGSLVLISTTELSSDIEVDITGIDGTYRDYLLVGTDIVFDGATGFISLRTSSDSGTSFDTGASDYGYCYTTNNSNTGASVNNDDLASGIDLCTLDVGPLCFTIKMFNPSNTASKKILDIDLNFIDSSDYISVYRGCGVRRSTSVIDAVRFYTIDTSMASGQIKLYGIK